MRRAVTVCALLATLFYGGGARAQDYPTRPVKLIVPFAPGGAVDVLGRVIAGKLAERFGQPVVIENRAGAGGNLAADIVAKAAPDGYTILQNTAGQSVTPALYRHLPFDPINDFAPVTQLTSSNLLLVASPNLPAKTLKDFIALAKAKPGSLNYGSSGVGNPLHLTMEMLKHDAGLDIQGVAYRGDAQINAALMAGEVQVAVVPVATAIELVKDGRLVALAVTGPQRSAVLPDVPTVAEMVVPGFTSTGWQGLFVPAKTPAAIVARISRDTAAVLKLAEVMSYLKTSGYEGVGSTPEEFSAFVNAETTKFTRVVAQAHIPPQD